MVTIRRVFEIVKGFHYHLFSLPIPAQIFMEWHEMNQEQRIVGIFCRYNIKYFWDWWNRGNYIMEVRIKDWEIIKLISKQLNIPKSASGVYVSNEVELKKVIFAVRDKTTCWFGINPRKKNYNEKGWTVYGGGDHFVENISYLFIDIDRIKKEGQATNKELENCDKLANLILDKFGTQQWNEDYIKICSGNGVQLLIALDEPILLPKSVFDEKLGVYLHNKDFEYTKKMMRSGIGKQLKNFSRKYKDKLGVEVDSSGFFMGKVGALPATKNYKYNDFTWRGVIEIKKGINDGLTDYIMEFAEDEEKFKSRNVFTKRKARYDKLIKKGQLRKNPLVRLLLDYDFPMGGINNSLWFQLKLLLRDSKYDLTNKEFLRFHNDIKKKHNRTFTLNMPSENMSFNQTAVNHFCIINCYPLPYPLFKRDAKKLDSGLEKIDWEEMMKIAVIDIMNLSDGKVDIPESTSIIADMVLIKNAMLMFEGANNTGLFKEFIKACLDKYGKKKTEFWFKNVFYEFFSKKSDKYIYKQ